MRTSTSRKITCALIVAAVGSIGTYAAVQAAEEKQPDLPLGVVIGEDGNPLRTDKGDYVIDLDKLPEEIPVLDSEGNIVGTARTDELHEAPDGPGEYDPNPGEPSTYETDGIPTGP